MTAVRSNAVNILIAFESKLTRGHAEPHGTYAAFNQSWNVFIDAHRRIRVRPHRCTRDTIALPTTHASRTNSATIRIFQG
jgi:hypothetical protein